ncbi:MAG: hypothetical protein HY681_04400 [Chloroflexi bacterium]|nr:hypothetical protein [Chloroflexota bacterium]
MAVTQTERETPPPLSLTHGLWSHYTVFDGLAGMRVEDVYQDSQGFVWIATADGGVSRFDGAHFDNLSVAEGLPHPTVNSIAEWEGLLWFGTFGGGLVSWDGHRFAVYTTTQGLPSDDILKLRVMADGRLAVATMRGVGWFVGGRCQERIEAVGGQSVGPVYDLWQDPVGRVWLATMQRGVVSADSRRLQAFTPEGRDILHHAWNLAQDLQGDLWIASNYVEATAYALRCRTGQAQPEVLEIAGANAQSSLKYGVRHVRADARGWVWHAFRGVFVFDGERWQQLAIPLQGREFADVRLSYEDREGNIWLGYWGGGLAFCDPSSLRRFSEAEGLPHREVTALAADRRRRMWIGTAGGMAVMEAGHLVPRLPEAEGPRLIHCLHLDQEGRLWAGADAGRVYCLEEDGLQIVQGADERVENAALCADGQGRLWVGQHPPGEVGWLEGGRFRPLREALAGAAGMERGLIGVDAIAQDPQGRMWFGARGDERALSCFDGRQLRVFGAAEGFVKTHYVHALAFGPDGVLWIGTGVGLVAYQGQRFRHYTVADGLPENAINALAFDRQGRLWIGTSGGGAVCWDGQVFKVIRLGSTPGENTVNTILVDHEDQVWFGTRAGLAAYFPNTLPPHVVIRQVMAEALYREPESLACAASVPEIRIRLGHRLQIRGAADVL